MSRNGSGTMAIVNTFTPSTTISSAAVNANFSDIGDELTNSLAADGQTTMSAAIKGANGSATTPAYGFASDTNTGMYRKAADSLGFATAGSERAYFDSAGKLFALGDLDVAGDAQIDGTLTVTGGITGALLAANNLDDLDDASTARTNLGLAIGTDVQAYDADTLKADTADDLTAGFTSTSKDQGTKSSGTFTPAFATGTVQHCVNGGAFTLGVPTGNGTMILDITNNASAGAITTSSWTLVSGDAFTTTNTDTFRCYLSRGSVGSHLHVVAF